MLNVFKSSKSRPGRYCMAVITVLQSQTSRDPLLMHLLRCLVFYAAWYHFDFVAEHAPGTHNVAADALSRNNLTLFSSLFPQAPHFPSQSPSWAELAGEGPPQLGLLSRVDGLDLVHSLFDQGISKAMHPCSLLDRLAPHYKRFCSQMWLPTITACRTIIVPVFAAAMSELVAWETIRSYLCGLRFFQYVVEA